METLIYIAICVGVVNLLGIAVVIYCVNRKGKTTQKTELDGELLQSAVEIGKSCTKEEGRIIRETVNASLQNATLNILNGLSAFQEGINSNIMNITQLERNNAENNERRIDQFIKNVEYKIDKLQMAVSKSLEEVRADNEKQLEKMRATVDEKLATTLETRLSQSFNLIGERIDAVQKGFGEIQSLAVSVADIKKVFTNIKTRGVWGEVQLANLLEQILVREQYLIFPQIEGREQVDFAVVLPGKNSDQVLLPLDSKFPLEDYLRLVEASENGDNKTFEEAEKMLIRRVKEEAKKIKDKYIQPPKTTDFAVMYLPMEGLYAEVAKQPGLLEEVQSKSRVLICGPSNLAALLNSFQMGFKTLAIEKRSTEIWKLLSTFKTEFGKFNELLNKAQNKAEEVSQSIRKVSESTNKVQNKLKNVEVLDVQADSLPLPSDEIA